MIGSVRALWPWQLEDRTVLAPPDVSSFVAMAILSVAGFVAVSLLIYFAGRRIERPVRVEPADG